MNSSQVLSISSFIYTSCSPAAPSRPCATVAAENTSSDDLVPGRGGSSDSADSTKKGGREPGCPHCGQLGEVVVATISACKSVRSVP